MGQNFCRVLPELRTYCSLLLVGGWHVLWVLLRLVPLLFHYTLYLVICEGPHSICSPFLFCLIDFSILEYSNIFPILKKPSLVSYPSLAAALHFRVALESVYLFLHLVLFQIHHTTANLGVSYFPFCICPVSLST